MDIFWDINMRKPMLWLSTQPLLSSSEWMVGTDSLEEVLRTTVRASLLDEKQIFSNVFGLNDHNFDK